MASTATQAQERFLADKEPPVCSLNIKDAFAALTKEESEFMQLQKRADDALACSRFLVGAQ